AGRALLRDRAPRKLDLATERLRAVGAIVDDQQLDLVPGARLGRRHLDAPALAAVKPLAQDRVQDFHDALGRRTLRVGPGCYREGRRVATIMARGAGPACRSPRATLRPHWSDGPRPASSARSSPVR